ncbi:hypothetical protein AB0L35_06225 [Streptomyces sp. NPDC052309]|uniref:hypothetical protein n=1 Tax=Streptomyces sp. NPDC052309 TaxID=3155421 RepID=UPI00342D9A23
MQRKDTGGRRGRTGYDVESVLDELYATPPTDFVSRREAQAAAARTAGHAEDARRIHAARRPTRAAWAANLLLRSQPQESTRFLELGQALREAHRTLDAAGLKELSAQRRSIVSALSRQAARLARDAGQPLSDAAQREVESTLRAVLADPDAADRWAGGRLESALTPPSAFPSGTDTSAASARRRASRPAAPSAARGTRSRDELAERRRRRREELARAEEAAEAASRRLRDRHAEHTDAESSLRRTHDNQEEARQRVSDAERRLRQAQQELERAERERREAEERARTAADALAEAEREAREAARKVERLAARVT